MQRPLDDNAEEIRERRARFKRAAPRAIRLTQDDLAIIRHLGGHRFLRSTHIVRLFPDRSSRKLCERLCELYHAGYLDRPRAQINYFSYSGSAPIIYALGNRGAELFSEFTHTSSTTIDWTDKNREVKRPYIEHALLLADMMVCLDVACRDRDDIYHIDAGSLLAMQSPNMRHAANPWRLAAELRHDGARHMVPAIPDAVFALHFTNENRHSYFFVEADRATMPISRTDISQSSYRRRLLAYLNAHKAKQHVEHFGMQNLRVLTITTSAERAASMVAAVNEITGGKGSNIFLFTDVATLAAHGNPLTLPWITTSGVVRIDQPPRFFPSHI